MRVTLIGSGNVATVLGRKILQSGHIISHVFSRSHDHAGKLANELSATPINTLGAVEESSDMYIVAVSDDELLKISDWLPPLNAFVVHTAGSVPMQVLKDVSGNYGVLYPLQTLRKEITRLPQIPILIDANTEWNKMKLTGFAQSFADHVYQANDHDRRKLHLAAVITNNFPNYIYALTEKYCEKESIDFRLLFPLLYETVARMELHSPAGLQTGPAVRNDESTIAKHEQWLHQYPELLRLYEFFSDQIKSSHKTLWDTAQSKNPA